jgi:ABC-type lipoprotein release transport system permease subunit
VLLLAPLATVALSVFAGIAASVGALRKRPIEVLRAE